MSSQTFREWLYATARFSLSQTVANDDKINQVAQRVGRKPHNNNHFYCGMPRDEYNNVFLWLKIRPSKDDHAAYQLCRSIWDDSTTIFGIETMADMADESLAYVVNQARSYYAQQAHHPPLPNKEWVPGRMALFRLLRLATITLRSDDSSLWLGTLQDLIVNGVEWIAPHCESVINEWRAQWTAQARAKRQNNDISMNINVSMPMQQNDANIRWTSQQNNQNVLWTSQQNTKKSLTNHNKTPQYPFPAMRASNTGWVTSSPQQWQSYPQQSRQDRPSQPHQSRQDRPPQSQQQPPQSHQQQPPQSQQQPPQSQSQQQPQQSQQQPPQSQQQQPERKEEGKDNTLPVLWASPTAVNAQTYYAGHSLEQCYVGKFYVCLIDVTGSFDVEPNPLQHTPIIPSMPLGAKFGNFCAVFDEEVIGSLPSDCKCVGELLEDLVCLFIYFGCLF